MVKVLVEVSYKKYRLEPIQCLLSTFRIVAVLTNGLKQRIDCRYVLMNPAYLPEGYCSCSNPSKEIWIDRAVHITNKSILEGDKEKVGKFYG